MRRKVSVIFCQTLLIHLIVFSNNYERREKSMDNIKDLPGEEWQEVQGYNGKYLVSNMGRIKSL